MTQNLHTIATEKAFEWLEKAYERHDPGLYTLKVDEDYASLRSNPRYMEMLPRIGLPP